MSPRKPLDEIPVIDVSPLFSDDERGRGAVAKEIEAACRQNGFFYAMGHGIDAEILNRLDAASRSFFALPEWEKFEIAMHHGGRAWRGYFPVGGELTSGKPDIKEGIYFGAELGVDDPRVLRDMPLHGANLFPARPKELKTAVLEYMQASTRAAHGIMEGIALSLGLDAKYFFRLYTRDPTILFRIFHYPPSNPEMENWGVGEHTDYGLLTLLAQDDIGGLQVKTPDGWMEARPVHGALICNIGDMLDRLTGGYYHSTPHRVRNVSGRGRLSFPFFFDPGFDTEIVRLPQSREIADDRDVRWDRESVHAFEGTYGDYLLGKVSKVFPELRRKTLV
jgi:isopenicillin N synthase-like dioxygenase